MKETNVIDARAAEAFLELQYLAVVGASDDPHNFGRTICHELCERGHDVVAVHPDLHQVDGVPCYPTLADVPDPLDGVIVMVGPDRAADVVHEVAARGVSHVWLFRGIGAPGAVSDAALAACREHGFDVVPGACPLMFLQPPGWFHRTHRAIRRLRHAVRG
jgi:predicted CoA-binding protein